MADKRTQITKMAVKEGLLELLNKTPFNFVTVAALCREAGVGRATFYKHYTGLTDVLDELTEDAIQAAAPGTGDLGGISVLARQMRSTTDPEALAPFMDLLPVCQRVADHPKYRVLFTDPFISEYILMGIYRHEREKVVLQFRESYNISETEADKLFLYAIYGAFAVNRSMNWTKDEAWYRVQRVLLTFLEGGYEALKKL